MTTSDLVILVADLDAENTVRALIERPKSLGIRSIQFEILRHPLRDSGCYNDAHDMLRSQVNRFDKAIVLFDHHGSGHEKDDVDAIQTDIEHKLVHNGWDEANVRVIVMTPELEIWVWSESIEVDRILKWSGRTPPLRDWIKTETPHWNQDDPKPHAPKEALEASLRAVKMRHSARLFADLGEKVSTRYCVDTSFERFKITLQRWFSEE